MTETQIIFIVIYFVVMAALYYGMCKRIDFLTKRNELKIGENVKPLDVMSSNLKWTILFVFVLTTVISIFLILTLL